MKKKLLLLFILYPVLSSYAYSQDRGEDGPDFMIGALGRLVVRRDVSTHYRQELDGPRAASWSPDGKKIIFWEEDAFPLPENAPPVPSQLYKYNLESGEKESLLEKTVYQESFIDIPYFSPDGSKIVFTYWADDTDTGDYGADPGNLSAIAYIDLEKGSSPYEVVIITGVYTGQGGWVEGATWVSDSTIAYVKVYHPLGGEITSEVWISDIDGSNAKKLYQCIADGTGGYEDFIQSLHPVSIEGYLYFTVSAPSDEENETEEIQYQKIGRIKYSDQDPEVEWVTAEGIWSGGDFFCEAYNLKYDSGENTYRMAFQSGDSYSDEHYIYIMEHNSDLAQMQESIEKISESPAAFPAWTYDGTGVIAVSLREIGEIEFILINADGSLNSDGSVEKLVNTAGVALPILWSPDGLFGYVTHGMNLFQSDDTEDFNYSDDPDAGEMDIFVARIVSFVSGTLLGVEGGVAKDTAFNRADVDEGSLEEESLVSVGAGPAEELPDMNRAAEDGAVYWDRISAQDRVYTQMSGNKFIPGSVRQFNVNKPLRKMVRYNIYYSTENFADLGSIDETKLRAYYWTGSVWERVGGTVDTESKTVSFYSNHSGVYGVFYEPQEPEEDKVFKEVKIQPNPFYPGSSSDDIARIKVNTEDGVPLSIEIYNIAGERVITLLDKETKPPGQWWDIAWDGRNYRGNYVASGVYLCFLKAGSDNKVVKIAVIR